jgi:hypothetical protein
LSRAGLTVQDGTRIDLLMEREGVEHGTTGPAHDRYGMETTVFSVTSPLARFLMRKGLLRPYQGIGVARDRYFTSYEVEVARVWESARYSYGQGAQLWRIRRIAVG